MVNTVESIARALHSLHLEVCGLNHKGVCRGFHPVNGSRLLQHLRNVSFDTYSGQRLHFDDNLDPPGQ